MLCRREPLNGIPPLRKKPTHVPVSTHVPIYQLLHPPSLPLLAPNPYLTHAHAWHTREYSALRPTVPHLRIHN